jgi:hypothetical protein
MAVSSCLVPFLYACLLVRRFTLFVYDIGFTSFVYDIGFTLFVYDIGFTLFVYDIEEGLGRNVVGYIRHE